MKVIHKYMDAPRPVNYVGMNPLDLPFLVMVAAWLFRRFTPRKLELGTFHGVRQIYIMLENCIHFCVFNDKMTPKTVFERLLAKYIEGYREKERRAYLKLNEIGVTAVGIIPRKEE